MNVLVIDGHVRDYQVFVDAVNESTTPIVWTDYQGSMENLKTLLNVQRIGFVFEMGTPMGSLLLESKDVLLSTGIKQMDFLACDTLSVPRWKEFYDSLEGVTVGASNDKTGNLKQGGDWVMESTCEDIELVYFTRSIEYYKYLLYYFNNTIYFSDTWGTPTGPVFDVSINVTDTSITYPIELLWTCGESGSGWQNGINGNRLNVSIKAPDLTIKSDLSDYINTSTGIKGFAYQTTETIVRDLVTPYISTLKLFYYGTSPQLALSSDLNTTYTITKLTYACNLGPTLIVFGTGLLGCTSNYTLSYDSNTYQIYTGYLTGSATLTKNGYSTDTISVNPVTINKMYSTLLNDDVVTVRGMPPIGKYPLSYGISSSFPSISSGTGEGIFAYCYFGYFKPTVTGSHSFSLLNVNDVANLRIGSSSIYSLRNQGATLLNLNSNGTTTSPVTLTANIYYPILITYVNTGGIYNLTCQVTPPSSVASQVFGFCTSDKSTPGLYFYKLDEATVTSQVGLVNADVSTNINRLFSPDWAYGTSDVRTFWSDSNEVTLLDRTFNTTTLSISGVSFTTGVTITGTGFHSNVDVYIDGSLQSKTYNTDGTISVNRDNNYTSLYLKDNLVVSNTYTNIYVSIVQPTISVTSTSDVLTFTGINLTNAVISNIPAGWTPSYSFSSIVLTAPVGTIRTSTPMIPVFTYNTNVIPYGLTVNFVSPSYVNTTIPTFVDGTTLTFTGSGLVGTAVKNLVNSVPTDFPATWSITVNDASIVITIPLGTIRTSISINPVFTKASPVTYTLPYGQTVTFISPSYVNLNYTTSKNTSEIITFTGIGLTGTIVKNLVNSVLIDFPTNWTVTVNPTTIIITIPGGSVRTSSVLNPVFTLGGTLDYDITGTYTRTYVSPSYVNIDSPTTSLTSTGETYTFTGVNLLGTIVKNGTSALPDGWTTTLYETSVVVSIPLGSVRSSFSFIPTFTLNSLSLDYPSTPILFTSSSYVNLNPTLDTLLTSYVLTFTGTNISDLSYRDIPTEWTVVVNPTTILMYIPFGTDTTTFTPIFTKVGDLSYPSVTFTPPIVSATKFDNMIVVQGNFDTNTSFMLDTKYFPHTFSTKVSAIDFNSSKFGDIGNFDVLNLSPSITGTNTITFTGTFLPTTTGQWKFRLWASLTASLWVRDTNSFPTPSDLDAGIETNTGTIREFSIDIDTVSSKYFKLTWTGEATLPSNLRLGITPPIGVITYDLSPYFSEGITFTGGDSPSSTLTKIFYYGSSPTINNFPITKIVRGTLNVSTLKTYGAGFLPNTFFKSGTTNLSSTAIDYTTASVTGYSGSTLTAYNGIYPTDTITVTSLTTATLNGTTLTIRGTLLDDVNISVGDYALPFLSRNTSTIIVNNFEGTTVTGYMSGDTMTTLAVTRIIRAYFDGSLNVVGAGLFGTTVKSGSITYPVTTRTDTQLTLLNYSGGDVTLYNGPDATDTLPLTQLKRAYYNNSVVIVGSGFGPFMPITIGETTYTLPILGPNVSSIHFQSTQEMSSALGTNLYRQVYPNLTGYAYKGCSIYGYFFPDKKGTWTFELWADDYAKLWISEPIVMGDSGGAISLSQTSPLLDVTTFNTKTQSYNFSSGYYPILLNFVNDTTEAALRLSITDPSGNTTYGSQYFTTTLESVDGELNTYIGGTNTSDPAEMSNLWVSDYTANTIEISNVSNTSVTSQILTIPMITPRVTSVNLSAFQRSMLTIEGTDLNASFVVFGNVSSLASSTVNQSFQVKVPDGTEPLTIQIYDELGQFVSTSFSYLIPVLDSYNFSQKKLKTFQVTGMNLQNTSDIYFSNTFSNVSVEFAATYDLLTIKAPDSSGNQIVTVTDFYGTVNTFYFRYLVTSITFLFPTSGLKDTPVFINGGYLANTSELYIGGKRCEFQITANTTDPDDDTITLSMPDLSDLVNVGGRVNMSILDKDGDTVNSEVTFQYTNPVITNITPLIGPKNAILTATGTNLENVKSVYLGTELAPTNYTGNIRITVPPLNGSSGNVSIYYYDNSSKIYEYGTQFIYQDPSVNWVEPLFGTKNTRVTITGFNLQNTTKVSFGPNDATNITINSSSSITVNVPFSTTGSMVKPNINVSVYVQDNFTNIVEYSVPFSYRNLTVTTLTPDTGPPKRDIVISGTYLENTSFVRFGYDYTTFVVTPEKNLSVLVPPYQTTGSVEVQVIDNLNNVELKSYAYTIPTVTGIDSTVGTMNKEIMLTGLYLNNISKVMFGLVNVPFTRINSTNISLRLPPADGTNRFIVTDDFTNQAYSQLFTYQNTSVFSYTPKVGPQGSTITLTGQYLSNTSVLFGNTPATVIPFDEGIRVKVPPGDGNVSFYVNDGYNIFTYPFTYSNMSITNILPLFGTGNKVITIEGTGLVDISYVNFNSSAGEVRLYSGGLKVTVPQGKDYATISVKNNYETEIVYPTKFVYQNPSLDSFSPTTGAIGSEIIILGNNLNNTSSVKFDTALSPNFTKTENELRVTVAPGEGNVSIYVTDEYQNERSLGLFTYKNPTVTTFSPVIGPRNTLLNMSGTNLSDTAIVWFNNVSANFSATETNISVKVPPSINPVIVRVEDIYGNIRIYPTRFQITDPYISSIDPLFAPKGSILTIRGGNLSGTVDVKINASSADILSRLADKIEVTLPALEGNASVYVIDNYGNQMESIQTFTYENPEITGFNPARGPKNSYINISGTNLNRNVSVKFNETTTEAPVKNTWGLYVKVPELEGNASIYLYDCFNNLLTFSTQFVYENPEITTFTPPEGPQKRSIVLSGNHLTKTKEVWFGDKPANFSVLNTQNLSVRVPDSLVNLSVRVVDLFNNSLTYPEPFIYKNPTTTNITPAIGSRGRNVTIEGTNLSSIDTIYFGNASAQFETLSTTNISVKVPPNTLKQFIDVRDTYGNVLRVPKQFEYTNALLNSFEPREGASGIKVTIKGNYLENASSVLFDNLEAPIRTISRTQIEVTVPSSTQTLVNASIRMIDIYNNEVFVNNLKFIYRNSIILGVDPSEGPQNIPIRITGDNLDNISSIVFVNQNVETEPLEYEPFDGGVAMIVPVGEGRPSIKITDRLLNTTSFNFSYMNPRLTDINPKEGRKGSRLNISGINLSAIDTVKFGDEPTTYSYIEGGLSVTVPQGSGIQSIKVTDIYTNEVSFPNFSYTNPTFTSIAPTDAPTNSLATLYGDYLTSIVSVKFGTQDVSFVEIEGGIQVTVPPGSGETQIYIKDNSNNIVNRNFIFGNPQIQTVNPSVAPKNSTVNILGSYLTNIQNVSFGTVNVSFRYIEGGLNVSVPEQETTSCNILVSDRYGNQTRFDNFRYTNPTLTDANPSIAPQRSRINLIGSNLSNISTVLFGESPTIFIYNQTGLNVSVPDGDGIKTIYVTDIYGNRLSFDNFSYINPYLIDVNPREARKNSTVNLSGTNLSRISSVTFGTQPASFRYIAGGLNVSVPEESTLIATVPEERTTTITVTDIYTNQTTFGQFIYRNPTVTSQTATARQRTNITLSGTNLTQIKFVRFVSPDKTTNVSFNEINGLNVSVPVGIGTPIISITDVYNNILSKNFSYTNPVLTSVNLSAPSGKRINLSGDYLTEIYSVKFGTLDASFMEIEGGINVSVADGKGRVTLEVRDIYQNTTSIPFTYNNPRLVNTTASFGAKNKRIELSGDYLQDTSYVDFYNPGKNISALFEILPNLNLSVTVPDSYGNVSIYTTDIYGNKSDLLFTYTETTITSIDSLFGTNNKKLTLTGDYLNNVTEVKFGEIVTSYEYVAPVLNVSVPSSSGNVSIRLFDKENNEISYPTLFEYRNASLIRIDKLIGRLNMSIVFYGIHLSKNASVLFDTTSATFIPSDTEMIVTVPPLSGNVSIAILDEYNNRIDFTSQFTYENPSVYSMNLSRGPKKTKIILSGVNLSQTVGVKFGEIDASYTLLPDMNLEVTVPPSAPSVTVTPVYVIDDIGNNTYSPDSFGYTDPIITSIDPLSGPFNKILNIYGLNLSGTSEVTIKNSSVNFSVQSDTWITALIPDFNGNGSVGIVDNASNIIYSADRFTFESPIFDYFEPLSGAKGSTVTLVGNYFLFTKEVYIQGIPVYQKNAQKDRIVCVLPDTSGNASILIEDQYGNTLLSTTDFIYTNPNVSMIYPVEGPVNRIVELKGVNLDHTAIVKLGEFDMPIQSRNSSQCFVKVPLFSSILDEKLLTITVIDEYNNIQVLPDSFLYYKTVLENIEPKRGPPGTQIILSGKNLQQTAHVYFEDVDSSFVVQSNDNVSVRVPPSNGRVVVYMEDEGANQYPFYYYTYRNPLSLEASPVIGTYRTTVTLTGDNLFNTTVVKLGNVSANLLKIDTEELVIEVPVGNGNVSIEATDNFGNKIYWPDFTYYNTTTSSIVPSRGPQGSTLILTGTNLKNTTRILFDGVPSPKFSGTNTSYVVEIPRYLSGIDSGNVSGNVSVVLFDRLDNLISAGNFLYENPGFVSISPTFGPNNTSVVFTGNYLSNMSIVYVGGKKVPVQSETAFRFSIPEIAITNNTPSDFSVPVTVSDPYGNTLSTTYIYKNTRIDSIHPASGTNGARTKLVGINLINTSYITIGNKKMTEFDKTDTTLQFIVPDLSGNVSVYVTDNILNTVSAGRYEYKNQTVFGVNVSFGPRDTFVDITGINLSNTSGVYFGGKISHLVELRDDFIQIRAPDSTGNVSIEILDRLNNTLYVGPFEYRNPLLTGVDPLAGPQNSPMILSGNHLTNTSRILFGKRNVSFRVNNGQLELTIPENRGNVSIQILDEVENENVSVFTYQNPNILDVQPQYAPKNASVTLTGEYLANVSYVKFGDVSAIIQSYDASRVVVTVPDSAGSVTIQLTDIYNNTVYSGDTFWFETPVIQAISPYAGTLDMGVTLYGNFLDKTKYVFFGNEPAKIKAITKTTIEVFVPLGSGSVLIRIIDTIQNVFVFNRSFTYFNSPASEITPKQKFSNQMSTKQIQAKMLKTNTKIAYQNTRTKTVYESILGLNYVTNRNLLLQYRHTAYMKYVSTLLDGPQPIRVKQEISTMLSIIVSSLTVLEYNYVFNIVVPEKTVDEMIVDSNVTFYVVQRVLGKRSYFIFKNLPANYFLEPGFYYTFDLSDQSNLGSRLSFSDFNRVPYKEVEYIALPGTPGSKVLVTVKKAINTNVLFVYNSVENSYEWGYSVSSIPIHTSNVALESLSNPIYKEARQYSTLAVYESAGPKYSINNPVEPIIFSGVSPYRYTFSYGTYYIFVPKRYPATLLNKGYEQYISFVGDPDKSFKGLVEGSKTFGQSMEGTSLDGEYTFSYGIVQLNVYKEFSMDFSFYCSEYGFMGGANIVHFQAPYPKPTLLTHLAIYNSLTTTHTIRYNGDMSVNPKYGFSMGVHYVRILEDPITFLNRGREHLFLIRTTPSTIISGPYLSVDKTPYYFYKGDIEIFVKGYVEYMPIYTINGKGSERVLQYNSFYDAPEKFIRTLSRSLCVHNRVNVLQNTYITFNEDFDIVFDPYVLSIGIYYFFGIPEDCPITLLNKGNENIIQIESLGGAVQGTDPSGESCIFYYGMIRVTIRGDFGRLSLFTLNNGYMGGNDMFVYDITAKNHASYPDPRSIPVIEPSTGIIRPPTIIQIKSTVYYDLTLWKEDVTLTESQLYSIKENVTSFLNVIQITNNEMTINGQSGNTNTNVEHVLKRGVYLFKCSEYVALLNKGKQSRVRMTGSSLQRNGTSSDGNFYTYYKGDNIIVYVLGNFGKVSLETYGKVLGNYILCHEDSKQKVQG